MYTDSESLKSIYETMVSYARKGDALGSAIYELYYAKTREEQIKPTDGTSSTNEWDKTEAYTKRIAQLLYEEILDRRAKYMSPSVADPDKDKADSTRIDPNDLPLISDALLGEYGTAILEKSVVESIEEELLKLNAIGEYIANAESGVPEDTTLLSKYKANDQNKPDERKTYTEEEKEENRVYYEQEGTIAAIAYQERLIEESKALLQAQTDMHALIQAYLDNKEYQEKKSDGTSDPDSKEPPMPTVDEVRKIQKTLIDLESGLAAAKTNVESNITEEKKYFLKGSTSIVTQMLDNLNMSVDMFAEFITALRTELELLTKKIDTSLSETEKGKEEVSIVTRYILTSPTITNTKDLINTDTAVAHAQAILAWQQLSKIQKDQYQEYYEQQGANAFVEYHTLFATQKVRLHTIYTEAQQKVQDYLSNPSQNSLTVADIKKLLDKLKDIESAESAKRQEVENIIGKEQLYVLPIGKSEIAIMMEKIEISKFSDIITKIKDALGILKTNLENDKAGTKSKENPTPLAKYPTDSLPTLKEIFTTISNKKRLIATIWHTLTVQQRTELYDDYKEVIDYQKVLDGTIGTWYYTKTEGSKSLEEGALLYALMQSEKQGTPLSFYQWQTLQEKEARIKDGQLSEQIQADYREQIDSLATHTRNYEFYSIQDRELTIESNNQAFIDSMNNKNSVESADGAAPLTIHWKTYESIELLTDTLKKKGDNVSVLDDEYEDLWKEYEDSIAKYQTKYKEMMDSHKEYQENAFAYKKQTAIQKYADQIYQEAKGNEIDVLGQVEEARKALRIAEGKYQTLKKVQAIREDSLKAQESVYTKNKNTYFSQYRDEYQMQEVLLYMAEEIQQLNGTKNIRFLRKCIRCF